MPGSVHSSRRLKSYHLGPQAACLASVTAVVGADPQIPPMKLQAGVWVSFLKSTCPSRDLTCILVGGVQGTPSSVTTNSGLSGLSGCTRSHVCIRRPEDTRRASAVFIPNSWFGATTSSSGSFGFFRINDLVSAWTMGSMS